ncbi:uncharacterized protein LOC119726309 [Patiria miniata]|uniref:Integrase catalytic domain-containing protein n=1 Tax=Patiria miniata TaxID=46514 RepID=A0A913ZQB6_PATMI|nr:uncharacterized protein LOC119726309 [Patiria miniata]
MSSVSSIFDPLGLVAPVLLVGKRILQTLCRDGYAWDDPISEEIRSEWEKWRNDILHLASLNIPRCYKPEKFDVIKSAELHHFSDASTEGYGQCSYLRLIDDKGGVCTTLVMGKSRVTPSKPVTIPRLELTLAVISVKVSTFLMKELEYSDVTQFYYTDSRVVLGYIANDSKRFHIFVANRVQKIRDHTTPEDWRHVDTKTNPADAASRGLSAESLIKSKLWWSGPGFLQERETPPPDTEYMEPSSNDPEVKKASAFNVHTEASNYPSMLERFQSYSNWFRLKRAVALCQRYMKKLRDRCFKTATTAPDANTPLTVDELQHEERLILRLTQEEAFPKEIRALSKPDGLPNGEQQGPGNPLNKSSPLYMLDPVIDETKLLRVGGRIKQAKAPKEIKHPILLPRHGHVTDLVIEHYHVQSCHSGRGMTLNSIRQAGFWILGARSAVTSHIWKCVTCRKLRRAPCGQKMAELPKDRLDPSAPFTYSAVDYFGPFMIKEGRKELKRWGVIFTCMASRAVHIETANSLNTDSFLNAYRRFTCRRGPVRQLRSDRGTNFIGGKNELDAALAEMDQPKISQELLKDSCDWVTFNMNVPTASHMGGTWERLIRSIRQALSTLLQKHGQQLDDELLRTLMTEAEAIVNSRPLTYVDMVAPDSEEPLTPSQLLTLKSKVVLPPPGVFIQQDLYCRRRWRRVQYLANQFWSRWKTEYLSTLQERKKWQKAQQNLEIGNIVMMVDDSTPRCQWQLARVVETYPSSDGHIRKVKLQTGRSVFERPIHKVVLLLDQGRPDEEPNA